MREYLDEADVVTRRDVTRHVAVRDARDVDSRARLHDVHHRETDRERYERDQLEVDERLAADTPELFQVVHVRDAERDREEDDRRDDHLHEVYEGVADRFHRLPQVGEEQPEHRAKRDCRENLNREVAVPAPHSVRAV